MSFKINTKWRDEKMIGEKTTSEKLVLFGNKPKAKSGRKKASGYPDIKISYKDKVIYLDCKTYSSKTKEQTFRTFYFSPSDDPKITEDAFHFLLSYELKQTGRIFVPVSWQLYTLENLRVQVKHEFNASNKDIYKKEFLLLQGKLK